jgi:hypothetical protein
LCSNTSREKPYDVGQLFAEAVAIRLAPVFVYLMAKMRQNQYREKKKENKKEVADVYSYDFVCRKRKQPTGTNQHCGARAKALRLRRQRRRWNVNTRETTRRRKRGKTFRLSSHVKRNHPQNSVVLLQRIEEEKETQPTLVTLYGT